MKRLTIDKYYKYIEKLDNLGIKEFLKDSVVASTYHLSNGEVGFVPQNKEYAYVLQNENAIEENWGEIYSDYFNEADYDLSHFVYKEFDPSKKIDDEVKKIVGKIDYILGQSGQVRDFSNLKGLGSQINSHLNKKENIHNQEAWVPVCFLIGEIICQKKNCQWYFNRDEQLPYYEFDVRNSIQAYNLWIPLALYFESLKKRKGKFKFDFIFESIINNPININ